MTNESNPTAPQVLPWTPPQVAPTYPSEAEVIRHLTEDEGYTPREAVDMINSIYAAWGGRQILFTFDQWEVEIMRQIN